MASHPTTDSYDESSNNPLSNDESVTKYIPHIDDFEDGIFYFGILFLIFGILFFLLVCFGCGHLSCGVNIRSNNRDNYEEI